MFVGFDGAFVSLDGDKFALECGAAQSSALLALRGETVLLRAADVERIGKAFGGLAHAGFTTGSQRVDEQGVRRGLPNFLPQRRSPA